MAGLRAEVSVGYSGQPFYPSAYNHQLSVPYHLQQTPTDLSCHHPHKNNVAYVHRRYNSSDSEFETEEEEFDFEDDEEDEDYDEDLPDTTPSRLLDFVNVVTNDIRSKFERNKGSDDFCDVYEERFGTTLSGRELYYADLLELANSNYGRAGRQSSTARNARSSDSSPSNNRSAVCSPNPSGVAYVYDGSTEGVQQMCLSGRCVSDYGLGPLEELFKKKRKAADNDRPNYSLDTSPIPMTMRKLPHSFWQEPGIHSKDHMDSVDFTDLFTQWNNDKCL